MPRPAKATLSSPSDGLAHSHPKSIHPSKRRSCSPIDDNEAADSEASLEKRAKILCSFQFLRLPSEVRNIIYHFALVPCAMLVVSTWKKRANGTASIAASLLRACKTVHAEARGILYSQPIQFGVLYDMVAWLQSIGPENRLYLRNVHIGSTKGFKASHLYGQAFSRKVARLLADAPNLQTLEIRAMHIPDIKWHRHMDQNGQIGQKWLIAAQHIAQLIYDEFRPVFSKALSRGKTPQQLRTFVKAHKNLFLGPSDKANYFAADVLALQLTPSELTEAEAEVAEHFEFLLERNLYYRRHPRYTQTPEIV